MFNRQLVLVAIDHATDVERTMDVALSTAKARGADVHVIQVVPHRAVHRRRPSRSDGLSSLTTVAVSPSARGSHRYCDLPTMTECAFIASRCEASLNTSFRRTPSSTRPRCWWSSATMAAHGSGETLEWWTKWRGTRRYPCSCCQSDRGMNGKSLGLRRILTPVDFSIASAVALRTAVDLSRRHGARVTLVHALRMCPGTWSSAAVEAWEVARAAACTSGSGCRTPSAQGGLLRGG